MSTMTVTAANRNTVEERHMNVISKAVKYLLDHASVMALNSAMTSCNPYEAAVIMKENDLRF